MKIKAVRKAVPVLLVILAACIVSAACASGAGTAAPPAEDPGRLFAAIREGSGLIPDEPAAGGTPIQEAYFPDEAFRNYVAERFDPDGNGILDETEKKAVREIYVECCGIASLKGIEFFPELRYLECEGNALTSLDLSGNTRLTVLYCFSNRLKTLNIRKCTELTFVGCYDNRLTSLDVSRNTKLMELDCGSNRLTSLDVRKNTALAILTCDSNQLKSLNVSKNPKLYTLHCENNLIPKLDVTATKLKNSVLKGERISQDDLFDIFWYGKNEFFLDCSVTVRAGSVSSEPDFCAKHKGGKYHIGKTAVLTGVSNHNISALEIPDSLVIHGRAFRVTGIREGACEKLKNLKKVRVGANVEKIGKGAFRDSSKLKQVVFTGTRLKSVGKKAFGGVYGKVVFLCPRSRLKAYRSLITQSLAPAGAQFRAAD